MIPPPLLTKVEEDEEKDLKKWGGWMDGHNGVISRAPVELINISYSNVISVFYLINKVPICVFHGKKTFSCEFLQSNNQ